MQINEFQKNGLEPRKTVLILRDPQTGTVRRKTRQLAKQCELDLILSVISSSRPDWLHPSQRKDFRSTFPKTPLKISTRECSSFEV